MSMYLDLSSWLGLCWIMSEGGSKLVDQGGVMSARLTTSSTYSTLASRLRIISMSRSKYTVNCERRWMIRCKDRFAMPRGTRVATPRGRCF